MKYLQTSIVRTLIGFSLMFCIFNDTSLASDTSSNKCQDIFVNNPGYGNQQNSLSKSQTFVQSTNALGENIIKQEILNYKILLYKITKLIQSESSNPTTLAALRGELSRRKGALLKIGVPSASMTLSSEDRVQLNKLERGEIQLSELVNSQQKIQTNSLSSELTTISLRKGRDLKTTFIKVESVEFSSKEEFYLIAGLSYDNGRELKLYNGKSDEEIITLTSGKTRDITAKFSWDEKYIAMSSANEFRVWKADTNEQIIAFRTAGEIVSYSFGSDSKTISLIEEDGTIIEIDVLRKTVKYTSQTEVRGDRVLSAYWPQNNDYVITFESDGNFHYYHSNGKHYSTIRTKNREISILHSRPKFSRDGRYAAIGGKKIFVYDLQKKKLIYTSDKTYLEFRQFTFDPSGQFLVVGSKNGELQIIDLRTGRQIFSDSKHPKNITQLDFSSNGSVFVSTGQDDPILWKVDVGNDLMTPKTDGVSK